MNIDDIYFWFVFCWFWIFAVAIIGVLKKLVVEFYKANEIMKEYNAFVRGKQMKELNEFRTLGTFSEVAYTISKLQEEVDTLEQALEMDKGEMS